MAPETESAPLASLEMARQASASHRWTDAVALYPEADRASLLTASDLEALGAAAWWTGDLAASNSAYERAYAAHAAAGDPESAARMALLVAAGYSHRLETALASGWVKRAERLLADLPESSVHGLLERARLNAALARGELDTALAHADEILAIATRRSDPDLMGLGLHDRGRVLIEIGRVDEGMGLLEEAMVSVLGDELSPLSTAIVYCNSTVICEDVADFQRAAEFADAAKRWCERSQISGFPGMCRVRRAEIIRLGGDWNLAESEARKATDELRDFALDYAGEGYYQIGEIRLRRGDFTAAEEAFTQAHQFGRDPQPGLAMLRFAQGQTDAARDLLGTVLDDPATTPLARTRLLPALAEVTASAGARAGAESAAQEMADLADRYGTHALRAAAAEAAGHAAFAADDVNGAIAAFRNARRTWQQLNAPYETARARRWLGHALTLAGQTDAAALELGAAITTFRQLAAEPDLRSAQADLAKLDRQPTGAVPEKSDRVFMFTDVVGSTDLIEAIGDEAWSSLRSWHDATIRHLVIEHRGNVVDHTGDGFFLAFNTADDAIGAAQAVRRRFQEHRRDHGFAPPVRIGLHAAEAIREGASYSGRGVHIAARVAALARADEILASEDVLAAAPSVRHGEMRTERLKGIRNPIRLASID